MTKLIVGLGNPGEKYNLTRHNLGFMVVDALAQKLGTTNWKLRRGALFVKVKTQSGKLIIIKPQTYMNASGIAVASYKRFFRVKTQDVLTIYDDKDINFGAIKTKVGGSSGGHNGVKSVIAHIGEDFKRIRVGVKNPDTSNVDASNFVLAKFAPDELKKLPSIIDGAIGLLGLSD